MENTEIKIFLNFIEEVVKADPIMGAILSSIILFIIFILNMFKRKNELEFMKTLVRCLNEQKETVTKKVEQVNKYKKENNLSDSSFLLVTVQEKEFNAYKRAIEENQKMIENTKFMQKHKKFIEKLKKDKNL